MNVTTIRSRSVLVNDRMDAYFFTAPGVAASERLAMLEATGMTMVRLGDFARVWDPPRFARAWAAPAEPGIPYLRPYDVFEFLPTAADRLSIDRNRDVEALLPPPGTLLQTCSGRNLGPCMYADDYIAQFALSHDMIRIEVPDLRKRAYVLVFLKTPTGQALLRRGKSGSVIDHLTTSDVSALPVPLLPADVLRLIVDQAERSIAAAAAARRRLAALLTAQERALPMPARREHLQDGWTLPASSVRDRLDSAYYDPLIAAAAAQVASSGGTRCGDVARASLPVRYKRYYVSSEYGRPILSGRQLLQLEPVNLRYVSDRSFRQPDDYVIRSGMTILGADGRAEGNQGAAALVTANRDGWLASNHVMRLRPHDGVRPGALWLAIAARQSRVQINALSFGSVVDQINPGDIEEILLPPIDATAAKEAADAWELFAEAESGMGHAVSLFEAQLVARMGHSAMSVA
jgi:hypothetical protein